MSVVERKSEDEEHLYQNIMSKLSEEVSQLKKKIEELQEELKKKELILKLVSKELSKKAEKHEKKSAEQNSLESTIQILSKNNNILGTITVEGTTVHIIPDPNLVFDDLVPPFQSFFVKRVLDGLKQRDESVKKENPLKYEIIKDEFANVKEIVITNVDDERTLEEIKRAVRWTLERLWERLVHPEERETKTVKVAG
ncbi:MAG: hypothetical protein ACP5IZ_11535 [Thermoprotei archaeon]|jgi:DNA gyrase/topoisomerase IV subunit A